ncbi:hypothetical protein C452_15335 [Haloferax volcanii JCM 10717]|uniref:Uncharacterized protein n=3 Tax=Haloferacaceae TaxID=1644056 RepID=M0HU64_HALVO|nr:hypothetical protein [Haloferax sp. BAB-2207]ELK56190.1 hypothetical protein D320_00588 [Haloferax sp. BAB-2207]ELZ75616.1 hypothetical protein C456_05683 [Haloferax lucentense DSM 14919]ELZ88155.1 hypothetical protein C452_15335 [Haloferax alexandrinus JCM 10717]
MSAILIASSPERTTTRMTLGPVVELAVPRVTNSPAPRVPATTVLTAPNNPMSRERLRPSFTSIDDMLSHGSVVA